MPHRFVDQRGCPNDLGLLSTLEGVLRGPLRGLGLVPSRACPGSLGNFAQERDLAQRPKLLSRGAGSDCGDELVAVEQRYVDIGAYPKLGEACGSSCV